MVVRRRYVHPTRHDCFAIHGMCDRQAAGALEDLREEAAGPTEMQNDENGGWKICGKERNQIAQRFDAARRGSDRDDVAPWH
jgi:hypothetical protein